MERVQQERREDYHAPFLRHALALPAGAPVADDAHQELHRLLDSLWRLRWDNQHKEVFWRLTLNGLPTPKRMGKWGQRCVCGFVTPDRPHLMWDCPVAHAVVQVLEGQLGVTAGGLQRRQVWLMQAPQLPAGPIPPPRLAGGVLGGAVRHAQGLEDCHTRAHLHGGEMAGAAATAAAAKTYRSAEQHRAWRWGLASYCAQHGLFAAVSSATLLGTAGGLCALGPTQRGVVRSCGGRHPLLRSAKDSPPRWVVPAGAPRAAGGGRGSDSGSGSDSDSGSGGRQQSRRTVVRQDSGAVHACTWLRRPCEQHALITALGSIRDTRGRRAMAAWQH